MKLTIKEVKTKRDLKAFVRFPNQLYEGNRFYVPQMESMDLDTLNPRKNHAFEVCEAKYWLATGEDGKVMGRIAGIINHRYNEKTGERTCRFGWMDFVDRIDVSKALMNVVERYAMEEGMDTVCGPMGFLEFDTAGVLVSGFDQTPTAYGKYNAPYYEKHLHELGFTKDVDFVEYRIAVPRVFPIRYCRMAKLIGDRYHLHEATIKNRSDLEPYLDGVFRCLNNSYSVIHGFSELTPGQCEDLRKQFLSHINVDFVSIILDGDEKVVAFGVGLPSLSEALQKARGRMYPLGWYYLLNALRHNDTLDLLLIAVDDEYKKKGVTAMIFSKFATSLAKHGIKYLESTRELEDNLSVQNLWRSLSPVQTKRARIYCKRI